MAKFSVVVLAGTMGDEALAGEIGPERVGVRLSPLSDFNDLCNSDPARTFGYAAMALDESGLAVRERDQAQAGGGERRGERRVEEPGEPELQGSDHVEDDERRGSVHGRHARGLLRRQAGLRRTGADERAPDAEAVPHQCHPGGGGDGLRPCVLEGSRSAIACGGAWARREPGGGEPHPRAGTRRIRPGVCPAATAAPRNPARVVVYRTFSSFGERPSPASSSAYGALEQVRGDPRNVGTARPLRRRAGSPSSTGAGRDR